MLTLTFDQVEQIAAQRYAAANSPAAVAVRAIDTLRNALEGLAGVERSDVLALLTDEVGLPMACEFDAF